MTEPVNPNPTPDPREGPAADESSTRTGEAGSAPGANDDPKTGAGPSTTATAILDSIRDAVDDLAERATPTVREISARAAELAAVAADRAAPLAKRAGEVTSEASGKLAERSRSWASDLRASLASSDTGEPASGPRPTTPPPAAPEDDSTPPDGTLPG
jgi:hypothetical protein